MPYDPIFPASGGGYVSIFPEDDEIITPEERLRRMRERFPDAPSGLSGDGPDTSQGFWSAATDRALAAWKAGYTGLADLATRSRVMPTTGPLKAAAERAEEGRRREMDEFAAAGTRAGLPPVATALADSVLEAVDPLDLVGGVAGSVAPAARLLRRGGRAATAAASPPDDLADLASRSLAIGEKPGSALRRDRALDQALEEAGETGLRASETPIGKEGKLRPPEDPFQYNASSLDVPESTLPEIRETMTSEKVLTRRRTGVGIDYDDPKRLRAEVGMAEEDFLKAPAGSIWNREEHALLDAYVGKWGRRVEELRPKVVAGKATETELEAFADARVKWIDLLATSMAGRTEVGRALESYKHLRAALDSPESLRTYLARKMGKSHGGKLTDEELDILSKADLDNPDEIAALLVKANKPKWWEYPRELFYSSILSGLGTHGRNVVGNAFHAVSQIPVRIGGAMLDAPLAKLSGRQRERYMSEVVPSLVGLREGFQEGMVRFAEAFRRHGLPTSQFDVPRSAFRRAPSRFVRERVAPVVDIPFRLLGAADELFKGINRGAELRALAVRDGVRKGLKGDDLVDHTSRFIADPPEEALRRAVEFEQKMTFTNPLGPTAKYLEKLKNSSPFLGYLVPFVRTPVNLFKRGIEFTPANLPRAVMMGVKGAPEAADELAKVATGSAMMGLAGMKAAAGELTGPPPTDRAERDAFYQQGKQPFSIKFGDRWFSFSQIEPLAMPLALVASAAEGARRGEADATNFEKMQKGMALLLANQLDRSYLSGLADVADLITYGASSEEVLTGFAGRQASALGIPFSGAMRTAANAIDPRIVEKRSFGDYFRANIPGLKQDLPARLTRFGEEIRRTRWQAVGPTGTPLVPTKEADGTIEAALRELQVNVGFPGESIEGVKLGGDEYREYLKRVGPQTKAVLEYLVADEGFQQMPPDMRQRIVDSFVQSTRDVVRTEAMLGLVPNVPPLLVKKSLGTQVDFFNSERSRVDGISSRYNERTRNRGQVGVEAMFEAGEEADQAWSQAYGGLLEAVTDARRQGLTDEQIVGLLRKKGLSHRVARAVVGGAVMSFQDYRNRRGDFE